MVTRRGFLEMLQMADDGKPKTFNDFTTISIKKRRLSSATVSKRLDELITVKALEEVVTRSKMGRRIIAHKTTEKGRRLIGLGKEFQEALAVSKAK